MFRLILLASFVLFSACGSDDSTTQPHAQDLPVPSTSTSPETPDSELIGTWFFEPSFTDSVTFNSDGTISHTNSKGTYATINIFDENKLTLSGLPGLFAGALQCSYQIEKQMSANYLLVNCSGNTYALTNQIPWNWSH